GQRVKKASASAITHFVFDEAGRLWGEYDATGNLIQETIWLDDLPVATVTSALNYVHPDHLATPRAITRASDNALLWRWDNTEAFGNSQPDSNPSGLGAFAYNLRFPGQYFDIETGTHYNYRRDYDPRIGRYVESDPIGLRGGLNTYAYVENDTLRKADPTGLFVPPPPGSVAGAAAAQGSAAAAGGIGRGSAGGSALGSALSRALNDAKRGACRTRCYINYEASEAICWAQHGLFGRDVEKYMACVGTAEAILKACLSSCDECYP
ncbi:MAG: RHS repeat-associated core domain-containing protein, partial [Usitatibacter sp.]